MPIRPDGPSWKVLGKVWPHHEASRFVEAGGMRWHVQEMGAGPALLLVHGTGASTHSWRNLMPSLAERFRVVAVDLPGHAFSGSPQIYRLTLPRVSALLGELVHTLGVDVRLAVGHSAGAAILSRMVLDRHISPVGLVSFNGAFEPFDGLAGQLFPALAKLLFVNPLTPRLFAIGGQDRARVARLIEGTGSHLNDEGLKLYHILMGSAGHIAGVLAMMANWDLERLSRDMTALDVPLLLIAADGDKAVPPRSAETLARRVELAAYEAWPGLGHLAHEEDPQRAVERIISFAQQVGVLGQQHHGLRPDA